MPITYDEAMVRALYKQVRPGVDGVYPQPYTYGRKYFTLGLSPFETRKDWLTGYGLDNNAKILVVGCAFGFMIEYLLDTGFDVWGIDNSPWVWANAAEIRADVLPLIANDWLGSGTEQDSLDVLPNVPNNATFGWILDEDAASSHSDAELPAFIDACEDRVRGNAKGRIIHLVSPIRPQGGGDSAVNWKTMAEWKAVAPSHRWVNINTGTIE
jgi:hypothetical protein